MQNYGFFFQKKLRYFKSRIQQNLIVYYFFLCFQHFWRFVFYFTYPNMSKNYKIFCSALLERLEILLTISEKILKVFLKKIWICEIFFFSKFCGLLFVFFIFFIIFDILFSISSICTCQQILEIFMFFILWIRDFIKEFWKIMEYFS